MLIGLVFAVPVMRTGRLAFSVGLHAGWNIFQNVIYGLPNSGKPSRVAFMQCQLVGPELATGGNFGAEGGLVVTA